jgi:hypothetical protein
MPNDIAPACAVIRWSFGRASRRRRRRAGWRWAYVTFSRYRVWPKERSVLAGRTRRGGGGRNVLLCPPAQRVLLCVFAIAS